MWSMLQAANLVQGTRPPPLPPNSRRPNLRLVKGERKSPQPIDIAPERRKSPKNE
jgi:hypothetical protein